MSNITKEWLRQTISDIEARRDDPWLGLDENNSNMLAAMKLALASLEAEKGVEPVAWLYSASFERGHVEGELTDAPGCDMPVYIAQPAPSVDEYLLHMAASAIDDLLSNKDRSGAWAWADVPAKLRRAAMLQEVK